MNGFGGITNFMMEKSARQYVADTAIDDKFYAWCFSRHPIPGNMSDGTYYLRVVVNETQGPKSYALTGTILFIGGIIH